MEPVGSSVFAGIAAAVVAVVVAPIVTVSIMVVSLTMSPAMLSGCGPDGGPGGGTQVVAGKMVDADQMDIARMIVDVVEQRHLPRRAAVLAVATAMVESGLKNLDHGDRDSLGVFQQRPSQGWGSPTQILDPVYATNQFLNHLIALPGWNIMPPGEAEQAVQRSAFPERYAPREPQAAEIVAKFWSGPDNPPPSGNPVDQTSLTARTGCPDQGGSNIPVDPRTLDPAKVPPWFTLPTDPRQAAAVAFALAQLGKPYVWGAKGPAAYDCSGLVLAAWAAAGIGISAGTTSQVHDGHPVAGIQQLQPGDLIFIPGALGTPANPGHVGLYAGHDLIVDAYDSDRGVILEPLFAWRNKIVAIRRVADPNAPSPSPGGKA